MEIHPKLQFSLRNEVSVDFNSCDFLVLLGKFEKKTIESLNAEARKHNICTTWSSYFDSTLLLLNDFGSFEMPASPTLEFPSFAQIFSKNAAKEHRNDMVKLFSTIFTTDSCDKKSNDCAAAAIAGALTSQEVVKSLSRKDLPINNFLAINMLNLKNIICRL